MIVNYNYINRSISTLSTYVTCLQWGDPLMDLAWFCASACLIVWSGKLARIARIRWYDISWRLVYWLWTKVLKRSKRTPAPAKPKGSEVWLLWSPYCCKKTGFVPYGLRCTKSQTYNWLSISIPEYTRSFNQSIHPSTKQSMSCWILLKPINTSSGTRGCLCCLSWLCFMVCCQGLCCCSYFAWPNVCCCVFVAYMRVSVCCFGLSGEFHGCKLGFNCSIICILDNLYFLRCMNTDNIHSLEVQDYKNNCHLDLLIENP